MKKLTAILLTLCVSVAIIGCESGTATKDTKKGETPKTSTPEKGK